MGVYLLEISVFILYSAQLAYVIRRFESFQREVIFILRIVAFKNISLGILYYFNGNIGVVGKFHPFDVRSVINAVIITVNMDIIQFRRQILKYVEGGRKFSSIG